MNRTNRVLWTVIGFVLLAVGVMGVLANRGWLPKVEPTQPMLTQAAIDRWNGWGSWAIAATVVAALLLSACGVLLLVGQLRRRGGLMRDPVAIGSPEGQTHVASAALQQAISSDLQTDRHVRRAAARLLGTPPSPRLQLQLSLMGDAEMSQVAGHVDQAVARLHTTSGLEPTIAEVVVTLSDHQQQRVH